MIDNQSRAQYRAPVVGMSGPIWPTIDPDEPTSWFAAHATPTMPKYRLPQWTRTALLGRAVALNPTARGRVR